MIFCPRDFRANLVRYINKKIIEDIFHLSRIIEGLATYNQLRSVLQ